MNLMLLPIIIMAFFSIYELLFPNEKRLNNQLYLLMFFVVFFIVAIKYYYGPDIHLYVPLYERIESPFYIFQNGSAFSNRVEIGFLYYCSLFKWLGCSFWLFSFSITCIYFYAVFQCFKRLTNYKLTALFVLVLLEANLLFFEFRQSISVTFFILSILFFFDKKYIRYIILASLSILFHKSAIFVVALSLVVLFLPTIKFSKKIYILLLFLLILGAFLSFGDIFANWIAKLPISGKAKFSILHHIQIEKNFQIIIFLYSTAFMALYHYTTNTPKNSGKYYFLIISFLLLIAIFYRYWFFLNRIRSYFTPFLILFITNELSDKRIKFVALKEIFVVFIYIYALFYMRGLWLTNKNSATKVLSATTIFNRTQKTEKQIRDENMSKSITFFRTEYLKNQLNK